MPKVNCKSIPDLRDSDISRFWSYVDKTTGQGPHGDCWEWTGATSGARYGQLNFTGSLFYAHRISWIIRYGEDPAPLNVLHSCDNPPCCNPDHLFKGNQRDNAEDMVSKKRHYRGPREWVLSGDESATTKISDLEVFALRERYSVGGITQTELARRYKIGLPQVNAIILGRERTIKTPLLFDPPEPRKRTVLTVDQRSEIRIRSGMGESARSLAREYRCCRQAIHNVIRYC